MMNRDEALRDLKRLRAEYDARRCASCENGTRVITLREYATGLDIINDAIAAVTEPPKSKLKLFVWDEVLKDYTFGCMVALAHDVNEARGLLLKEGYNLPARDLCKEPRVIEECFALVVFGGG